MSIVKIEIDVDVEKIAQGLLTKEIYDDSFQYNLNGEIKNLIKSEAISRVVGEIRSSLNLGELLEHGYSKNYLKEEARNIITKELRDLITEHAKEYVKRNLRSLVENNTRQIVEQYVLPICQTVIDKIVVVNQENIDGTIAELERDAEEREARAYEDGKAKSES